MEEVSIFHDRIEIKFIGSCLCDRGIRSVIDNA